MESHRTGSTGRDHRAHNREAGSAFRRYLRLIWSLEALTGWLAAGPRLRPQDAHC
jgi:hypothetical protein